MKEIKENKTLKLSEIVNWTVMTENSKKVNVRWKKKVEQNNVEELLGWRDK